MTDRIMQDLAKLQTENRKYKEQVKGYVQKLLSRDEEIKELKKQQILGSNTPKTKKLELKIWPYEEILFSNLKPSLKLRIPKLLYKPQL